MKGRKNYQGIEVALRRGEELYAHFNKKEQGIVAEVTSRSGITGGPAAYCNGALRSLSSKLELKREPLYFPYFLYFGGSSLDKLLVDGELMIGSLEDLGGKKEILLLLYDSGLSVSGETFAEAYKKLKHVAVEELWDRKSNSEKDTLQAYNPFLMGEI